MMPKEPTLGDLLKSETNPALRQSFMLDDVKIGEVIIYAGDASQSPNFYAPTEATLALSNSEHGQVLVCLAPCVIDISQLPLSNFKKEPHKLGNASLALYPSTYDSQHQPIYKASEILQLLEQSALKWGVRYHGIEQLKALAHAEENPEPPAAHGSESEGGGSSHSEVSPEPSGSESVGGGGASGAGFGGSSGGVSAVELA